MSKEIKCTLCLADFRPNVMVELPAGVPKCPLCAEKHPEAITRAEIQVTAKNKIQDMTETRVRAIIYEILEAANIKRRSCETCREMFFPRGPVQKVCQVCKDKADAKKETK